MWGINIIIRCFQKTLQNYGFFGKQKTYRRDFSYFPIINVTHRIFSVLLQPICGVPCGLNRESGVNPGQFPLLCWLQRLPWRHWKPCLSGRRQEKTSVRRPASSRETRLPGIGAGILFITRYAPRLGTIFILGIPTFFQRFWGNERIVKPIETVLCISDALWITKTLFYYMLLPVIVPAVTGFLL